jgi:glycosyltransferase involved in cell wall biosynthesis
MEKQTIGIIFYSNPDQYPPTINAIHQLSKKFNIILVARNQDIPSWEYPENVAVYRLGNYSSASDREQIPAIKKLLEYINFIGESRNILKCIPLIFAYDPWAYVAINIINIITLKSRPVVYQIHELYDVFPLTSLFGWIQKLEKMWVNNALLVIQPELARAEIYQINMSSNERPLVVPNFPLKSFYQVSDNHLAALTYQRFSMVKILLQGAISTDSSVLELIESITELPDNFRLKLIGYITNDNFELLSKAADEKEVASRVEYCERVPYRDLLTHTWNASVGTCLKKKTSLNLHLSVTSSNKIYEYAACGLPVIVSDFYNYKDYLSKESWVYFVNPDDSKAIVSAILEIFTDFDTYHKMCIDARKAFEEKYNYEIVFQPVISIIADAIN